MSAAYAAAGEAIGKDMARRLGENTRRVFHEVLGQLRSEMPETGSEAQSAPGAGARPRPHRTAPVSAPASGPASRTESGPPPAATPAPPPPAAADPALARAALERIRRQFQSAAVEWKLLQGAVDEIRREFARRAADGILGARAARQAIESRTAVEANAAAAASRPAAAPSGAADAAPGRSLESKLDELIALVRDQMAEGMRSAPAEGGIPSDFTHQVAREVVCRLKESLPLAGAPAAPQPERPGEPASPRQRISLDDVAGMIDQITGGSR